VSGTGRPAPAGIAGPAVYQGARPVRAEPAPSVALLRQFPPRPAPAVWPLAGQPGPQVIERLLAPPFAAGRRDYHERLWNPPMPLLFQRRYGGEDRPIGGPAVRELINDALASTGLTDASGKPLRFVPHDFRRILSA